MKKLVSLLLAVAMLLSLFTAVSAESITAEFLYVSPDGDDSAAGTSDAPLKTIEAAVKKAEGIDGAVVVNLKEGAYQITDTINFGEENSNLVIRAQAGEDVLVTGGTVIPYSAFSKCTDEAFLNALVDKKNKDKIVSVNLKELGVKELGILRRQGMAAGGGDGYGYGHTLSYNDRALTIARYPNEGYIYTESVIVNNKGRDDVEKFFNANIQKIEYTISDTRYKKWNSKDIWALGYFEHDWADTTAPAEFTKNNTVIGYTSLSYGVAENRRVYYFNIPEELDIPGEWYLDNETGVLYMIPVEGMKDTDTLVYNSFNKPLFYLENAKNIEFSGITFSGTCARGIDVLNCDTVLINDCEFANIGDTATYFSKSYRVAVKNSYYHDLGSLGIFINECGDRQNLVPGECIIDNCHFERYSQYRRTYSPAIQCYNDVGTVISHNEIHDAPHFAIRYDSNDAIIEYNEFYDVCKETADTGAVYTGRHWETRGCEVRYNYFHDMSEVDTTTGMEKMGIYLDDCSSSTKVHGNVFFNIDSVALIGGGRNNQFTNNVMIDCNKPLVFDERGLTWNLDQQKAFLETVPYKEGIWAEKYPELVNIMEDDPGYPKYNVLKNNVIYQTPEFRIYPAVEQYSTVEKPVKITKTSEFVDFGNKNFAFKEDSEVFTKLPEFENIPFDKIGRYDYTVEDKYVKAGAAEPVVPADGISVLLNGEAIDFADVAPQIINDRTMVPLRAIFEALGAEVLWDDATKTVTAARGDVTIKMTIGADSFTRNGESISLDSPATIVDSRTLVPVRAIAESFGSTVGWIAESKTVTITD